MHNQTTLLISLSLSLSLSTKQNYFPEGHFSTMNDGLPQKNHFSTMNDGLRRTYFKTVLLKKKNYFSQIKSKKIRFKFLS